MVKRGDVAADKPKFHISPRIKVAVLTVAFSLFGKQLMAQEQIEQDNKDDKNKTEKVEVTGSAGLRQPMVTITAGENGFTTTGATLGMADGKLDFKNSGISLSGKSVFLMNANFNEPKFNLLMVGLNATMKKTFGDNSSAQIRIGRVMKGQEMHFMNGVQAPQSDLYATLLKKFGNQSDLFTLGYETTIKGIKTSGDIGFAVPARGGLNMFVNMDDPKARQFIADLSMQSNDILGIDAIKINTGVKLQQGGIGLSGNLAVEKGKTGMSAGVQDFNPQDKSGLWLFRISQQTERFGMVFVNLDGTFTENLGNGTSITFGMDLPNSTFEAGVTTTKEGAQITGSASFKIGHGQDGSRPNSRQRRKQVALNTAKQSVLR